jgi:hypothetical protein
MARVKKVWTPKPCKCGLEPTVGTWTDAKKDTRNAAWIECECGMLTKSFSSKNLEVAKTNVIKMWNQTSRRRKIKGGIKSCEKCGSNDVNLHDFGESFMIFCEGCGLCTEECHIDGSYRTKKEVKDLWNS